MLYSNSPAFVHIQFRRMSVPATTVLRAGFAGLLFLYVVGASPSPSPSPSSSCVTLEELFPGQRWVSPNATLFSNSKFELKDSSTGDISVFQTVGVIASSNVAGSVGSCEEVVMSAPVLSRSGTSTGSDVAPSTTPTPFKLAIDTKYPIIRTRVTPAFHLAQHSIGLVTTACDLTPSERAKVTNASITPNLTAIMNAINEVIPGASRRMLRDAESGNFARAHETRHLILQAAKQVLPDEGVSAMELAVIMTQLHLAASQEGTHVVSHETAKRGSGHPGAKHMQKHTFPSAAAGGHSSPERLRRSLQILIDDIAAGAALSMEAVEEVQVDNIQSSLSQSSYNLGREQMGIALVNQSLGATQQQLADTRAAADANQAAIGDTISASGNLNELLQASSAQMIQTTKQAGKIAADAAAAAQSNGNAIASMTNAFANQTSSLNAIIASVLSHELASLKNLSLAMQNNSATERQALASVAAQARQALVAISAVMDANEAILRMFFRSITDYTTRVRHRAMLSPRFHATVRTMTAIGFRPFVTSAFGPSAPGPAAAWRPSSPLRVLNISTTLFLRTQPLNATIGDTFTGNWTDSTPTHTVIQDRITIQCDPVSSVGFLTQFMTGIDFIDAFSSAVNGGSCATPAMFAAGTDGGKPSCLCWAVVDRMTCPTSLWGPSDSIVAAVGPGPTHLDHPRVLTTAGISGWVPPEDADDTKPLVPPLPTSQTPSAAGFRAATPCVAAPSVLVPESTLVEQPALISWLGDITCNALDTIRDITLSESGSGTAISLGDVYVASVTLASVAGITPYVFPVPSTNGLRDEAAKPSDLSFTPLFQATAGAGTLASFMPSPMCSTDARIAGTLTTATASPMSLFLQMLVAGWSGASATYRFAQEQAFGYLTSDVVQETNPYYYERVVGRTTTCMSAEIAMTQGNWEPVGVATIEAIDIQAHIASQEAEAPGVYLPVQRSSTALGQLSGPFIHTIDSRFVFAGSVACMVAKCTVPTTGSNWNAEPIQAAYVYDVNPDEMPLASESSAREGTLTYLANSRSPSWAILNVSDPATAEFTSDDWAVDNGVPFDAGSRAGTLQNSLRLLVDVPERCGPRLGLADRVCLGDLPESGACLEEALATNDPSAVAVDGICFKLRHNVLFVPDLDGADAWVRGTPNENCGVNGTLCWVPRRFTIMLPEMSIATGSRALAAVAACPLVRTNIAAHTGFPLIEFRNGADVALSSWAYRVVFLGINDTVDSPAVTAEVRQRVCFSGSLTPGDPLAPGETMAVMWPSVCASWRVDVFQGQSNANNFTLGSGPPCNSHVLKLRTDLDTTVTDADGNVLTHYIPSSDANSGSGSGSGSGYGSGSGSGSGDDPDMIEKWVPNVQSAATVRFVVPGLNSSIDDDVGTAQQSAASNAASAISVLMYKNTAMDLWMKQIGIYNDVSVARVAAGLTATDSIAQTMMNTATNVSVSIGGLANETTQFVSQMNNISSSLLSSTQQSSTTIAKLASAVAESLNASNAALENATSLEHAAMEQGQLAHDFLLASRIVMGENMTGEAFDNITNAVANMALVQQLLGAKDKLDKQERDKKFGSAYNLGWMFGTAGIVFLVLALFFSGLICWNRQVAKRAIGYTLCQKTTYQPTYERVSQSQPQPQPQSQVQSPNNGLELKPLMKRPSVPLVKPKL